MSVETPGLLLDQKTFDNKLIVQSSPRVIGTFNTYISEGDNLSNPVQVGDGAKMILDHKINDSMHQTSYIDFNIKENATYLREGIVLCKDCDFDKLRCDVVPTVTTYTSGTNTNFNLYGGFLIVPAPENGIIQVLPQDIRLIEVPWSMDDHSKRQMSGFWDADYDEASHQYSNIRPNPYGTGQYNIFGAEINFVTIADIILLGDSSVGLHSTDVAVLGSGMRCKLTFATNAPDHAWKCSVVLSLTRIKVAKF